MTSPKDFDKVIQKRLESLGKTKLKTKKPPKKAIGSQKPVNAPISSPTPDGGDSEGKGSEKAQKAKQKRQSGHVKVRGRGKSRK